MAEVVCTLSQMISAFKTHNKISNATPEEFSHTLLLFYAVECGLKAKYLKQFNGLKTTDFATLPVAKKYGYGHDIWEWVKMLKLPANGYNDERSYPIVQMHERLRYGAFSKNVMGSKQVDFLKYLASILKKEL